MAPAPKKKAKPGPRSSVWRRPRLRTQGLRPVQHWLPDLRDPRILKEIRREGAVLSRHPENKVIDDWPDTIRDPEGWA